MRLFAQQTAICHTRGNRGKVDEYESDETFEALECVYKVASVVRIFPFDVVDQSTKRFADSFQRVAMLLRYSLSRGSWGKNVKEYSHD